jgi:hypothetical protein
MEVRQRQSFVLMAMMMYGEGLLSLGSSPLYVGLGGPLGPSNTVYMTCGNPRDEWGPKP